mmetsp:Transcript_16298/g.36672  ORF Transcript_16298/g.36672 Transcript_16298/m.36672 type:complete len:93 (-) Transcript_16298:65-343(-)
MASLPRIATSWTTVSLLWILATIPLGTLFPNALEAVDLPLHFVCLLVTLVPLFGPLHSMFCSILTSGYGSIALSCTSTTPGYGYIPTNGTVA